MTELNPKSLRRAFGSFMTGVTIVTAIDRDGTAVGFTANSFSSVSLEPPLLSVCPAKSLSSFEIFKQCEYFQVSVLAHDQQKASNVFAANSEDRFSQIAWHADAFGCPIIDGAIASFSCKRDRSIDAGDHIILLGEVVAFESHEKQGLGYGIGGYFSLNLERAATELQTANHHDAKRLIVGGLVEHRGQLLLSKDTHHGYTLPHIEIEDEQPSFDTIHEFLETQLKVPVEIGSVFSMFEHEKQNKSSIYYRAIIAEETRPEKSAGEFYSIDQLEKINFSNSAISSLVARYISERHSGNHSLYVGTDAHGKTHKIKKEP